MHPSYAVQVQSTSAFIGQIISCNYILQIIFTFIITLKDLSIHPINEQFNFNIQNGDSGRQAWQNYREKVHVHSSTVNNMYSFVGVHKIYFNGVYCVVLSCDDDA